MRSARQWAVPPSKYLGLGYEPWGETDVLLTSALDLYEVLTCSCGCGGERSQAHDPALAGRWVVEPATCYRRAALTQYRKNHEDDLDESVLLGVRLLAPGEVHEDAMEFNADRAAQAYAEHQARMAAL